MENNIVVRFAPSPTGFLHLGSGRTALFNWLFAKSTGARFILRIEDTDTARNRQEFLDEIISSLKWLGIHWDDIYYQSRRLDLYRSYAQKLIKENKAVADGEAVIFKYEFDKIEFDDLIRGHIEFKELPKDSEVLIKSDGTPTYNFSCCVDDALLGINYVIRGEDHISNTPKQILIYKALGFDIPRFAHLPMILSQDGSKMSKRLGAVAIREYEAAGYLPQALVNYLLLLGWSPGHNREIISFAEAAKIFKLKDINKTAAAFSQDKLNWLNSRYIKRLSSDDFLTYVREHLKDKNFFPPGVDADYAGEVLLLFKSRITKLSDLREWAYFCFYDDYEYAEDALDILSRDFTKEITALGERLGSIDNFNKAIIEQEFRAAAMAAGLPARDLVHPVRVALTGRRVGPGLFETMEVLGKARVVKRLRRLVDYWEGKKT